MLETSQQWQIYAEVIDCPSHWLTGNLIQVTLCGSLVSAQLARSQNKVLTCVPCHMLCKLLIIFPPLDLPYLAFKNVFQHALRVRSGDVLFRSSSMGHVASDQVDLLLND